MKNLTLTTIMLFAFCLCYSQNKTNIKSVTSNTVQVSKNLKGNSQYVGRYNLKNADSLILFDYFNISEKNGKLYCVRESKIVFTEANTNKEKNNSNHFDCEVVYADIVKEKISFKFNNKTYSYKFKTNSNTHRCEIIIIENALVYEKR